MIILRLKRLTALTLKRGKGDASIENIHNAIYELDDVDHLLGAITISGSEVGIRDFHFRNVQAGSWRRLVRPGIRIHSYLATSA